MKQTEIRTVQESVTIYGCDICEQTVSAVLPCRVCRKDVCKACLTRWYYDPFDGHENGDYPPPVCKPCDEAVQEFAERYKAIMVPAEEAAEKIRTEWETSRKEQP